MKTGSPKTKNMIASQGIDGSQVAELFKEAWRAFRSLLKASPNLMKMDVEKLKHIHVLDHLLKRKKRNYSHRFHSTSTVLTFDHISHPVHEAAAGHHNISLVMERIRDGGGASRGCSVSVEEVDELADAFISRFYSNVKLERQQSYRRYQEMLARGA